MLHDHAPTPLSTSKPYIISAMDDLSSHERTILSLLIMLSLAMAVLLFGEARTSVAGLKARSGRHPMLGFLAMDDMAQAVAEYKAEPTQAGRVLIVLTCVGLVKPFIYLAMTGLCIGGYIVHFFMKDPQLGAGAEVGDGDFR